MPGFATHYIAGTQLKKMLPNSSEFKKIITKYHKEYQLGLQGPDIFFSYIPGLIGDTSKSIGSLMHEHDTNSFFQQYYKQILQLSGYEYNVNLSYFLGLICHYYVDTTCHPFIYEVTNGKTFKKSTKNRYSARHRSFETLLDSLMLYEFLQMEPVNFYSYKTITLPIKSYHTITNQFSQAINKIYTGTKYTKSHYKTKSLVKKSVLMTEIGMKLLHDKSGKRKKIIAKLERTFIGYPILSSLISDPIITKQYNYLTKKVKKQLECSIKKCSCFYQFFETDKNLKTIYLLGNNSYHTGTECID